MSLPIISGLTQFTKRKTKTKNMYNNRKQVDLTCHICLMLFDVWHNLYWGLFSRIFITYDLILDCGWKLCRWLMKRVRNPNLESTCPPCRHNYDLWPDGWPWLGAVNGNAGAMCCCGRWLPWKQGRDSGDRGHKVRDDEDGHLIYTEGDILQARCTWHFVMF